MFDICIQYVLCYLFKFTSGYFSLLFFFFSQIIFFSILLFSHLNEFKGAFFSKFERAKILKGDDNNLSSGVDLTRVSSGNFIGCP